MKKNNSKKKRKTPILILLLIVVIAVAGAYVYQSGILTSKEGTVTTISTSSLEEILEISELSTIEYTYNAIAKAYDSDGTTIKYYVAYEGIVKAGVDFSKIVIDVNEDAKKVSIIIPNVQIQDVIVDIGTMEYIFTKNKYETETITQEAYKISIDDLRNRANNESELLSLAKENAIVAVEGLIRPWIEQVDKEYTVEIQ